MEAKLPLEVATPEHLHQVHQELERYLEWLRASRVDQRLNRPTVLPPPKLTAPAIALLTSSGLGPADLGITKLEPLINNLRNLQPPVLHLILTDVAPPALVRQLIEWVRRNCHPQALIQLAADSTLGGGVIIRTPSHLYDHSFRTQLLDKRDRLLKVMANVR